MTPCPSLPAPTDARRAFAAVARRTARHGLAWLAFANAAGVLMALLLAWPELNDFTAPFTYGRWATVHLNGQLYGWCSVPLLGVLLRVFLDPRHPHAARHAGVALAAWSLALAAGCIAWLTGQSSGKLFMEWSGWSRPALPAAMLVLWTVLAAHAWWRRPARARGFLAPRPGIALGVLAALLVVPAVFFWAAGARVYPPVNPDSGGATGASLLGSTLGIITLYGALPLLLDRPRRAGAGRLHSLGPQLYVAALVASWLLYATLNHGAVSHHHLAPQVALGTLMAWVPLSWLHFGAYTWPATARRWLVSGFLCWTLLIVDGWLSFLPGFSETMKFTHGLVAHAHLAMAGFITAVNHVILPSLSDAPQQEGRQPLDAEPETGCRDQRAALPAQRAADAVPPAGCRTARAGFILWHLGLALHFIALIGLYAIERDDISALFLGSAETLGWLWLRAGSGGVLLAASALWLRNAFRT
jgi:cytochrome c oxidase cbb3-type subunit 1